jgi:glycosyltransferase involved in cell wall biosynthesis
MVVLSDDMAAIPRERRVPPAKLHLVPNWAPAGIEVVPPADSARLRAEWQLAGKFVVLYFGNLGRVHDLEAVLDIAARLQDEPDIQFVFIGPGPQRAAIEASARERRLDNVRFFPAQPRERRTEILALGDLHLVTLREGGERVVFPSKLYGICAAARPVLFIGPPHSEIAELVRREALGVAYSRRDVDAIVGAVRMLRGSTEKRAQLSAAGRAFYERTASISHAAAQWERVLASLPS